MPTSKREQWIAALQCHEREIDALTRAVERLDAAAANAHGNAAADRDRLRRQIEFATAQLTRHRISRALLVSQLASAAATAPGAGGYSHSIVAGGFDEMS